MNQYMDEYDPSINEAIVAARDYPPKPHPPQANILVTVLRRWRIIILLFVIVCGIGIPPVWFFVKPKYQAVGVIQVAPVISSVLYSDSESDRVMPDYARFKNSQADYIFSPTVLDMVADKLAEKNIDLFTKRQKGIISALKQVWERKDIGILLQENSNPIDILRKAISDGKIRVDPEKKTDFIKISMESSAKKDNLQVINAFLEAYKQVVLPKFDREGDEKIKLLDEQRRLVTSKVEQQQGHIYDMAKDYGTHDLTSRYEMKVEKEKFLEQNIADLESKLKELDRLRQRYERAMDNITSDPNTLDIAILSRRQEFINNDERISILTGNLIQAEQDLLISKEKFAKEDHPEIQKQEKFIQALNDQLETRRREREEEFENVKVRQVRTSIREQKKQRENKLAGVKEEFIHLTDQLNEEKKSLKAAREETFKLGRQNLSIQREQEKLASNKELLDDIRKRIQQMEIERKRPGRISFPYEPASVEIPNRRNKMILAIAFMALASGCGLAFLRDKADKNLYTPDDVIRIIDVPIIGTTISVDRVDRELVADRLTHDYQTIRANLKLLGDGAIPRKLVVTSSSPREGKTTFAINLATSLAKSGKRVLLIDGDLRKPDVGKLLNISAGEEGFRDVVLGACSLENVVCAIPLSGLHVLPNSEGSESDPIELLSRPETAECLDKISGRYDHVIIDTPPVLIVADALLWAKMADAVVFSSLAGQSAGPALKEAVDKLSQMKVNILGNVLCNVNSESDHYRYSYGYNYGYESRASAPVKEKNRDRGKAKKEKQAVLLMPPGDNGDNIET